MRHLLIPHSATIIFGLYLLIRFVGGCPTRAGLRYSAISMAILIIPNFIWIFNIKITFFNKKMSFLPQ
jgi:hypothetical protein